MAVSIRRLLQGLHHEQEAPKAYQLNPASSSEAMGGTNSKVATVANNGWATLRLADGGLGTWGGSVAPTEYREA